MIDTIAGRYWTARGVSDPINSLLIAAAFTFLGAVVSLDVFWVRVADELRHGDIAGALRKRSWLNAFVAAGAAGAVILLWVLGQCTNGAF